jgi:hypothetical protein
LGKLQEEKAERLNKVPNPVLGVKGLPVFHSLPHFDAIWSLTPDTLHVVCEGLIHRILELIFLSRGNDYSLLSAARGRTSFDIFDLLMKTTTRISELDHLPPLLSQFPVAWKAIDYYMFLMTQVALVLSDEEDLPDLDIYEILVYLANAMYYLHHGRQSAETLCLAEENLKMFAAKYTEKFSEMWCVWKFHVFQHFAEFAKKHGPAYLWDSFMLEQFVGLIGRSITATRNQAQQAIKNFLTRLHSPAFTDMETVDSEVKTFVKTLGFGSEYYTKETSFPTTFSKEPFAHEDMRLIKTCLMQEGHLTEEESQSLTYRRVTRMRRRSQIFASVLFKNRGVVDETWVNIGEIFGQIGEICFIEEVDLFLMLIDVHQKKNVRDGNRVNRLFPVNQFPIVPTNSRKCFAIQEGLMIQKMLISQKAYKHGDVSPLTIAAILPHDEFVT